MGRQQIDPELAACRRSTYLIRTPGWYAGPPVSAGPIGTKDVVVAGKNRRAVALANRIMPADT